jgi:hypothetical protein
MKARWIALLIVLIALMPDQVTSFCKQVFDAATTAFTDVTDSR